MVLYLPSNKRKSKSKFLYRLHLTIPIMEINLSVLWFSRRLYRDKTHHLLNQVEGTSALEVVTLVKSSLNLEGRLNQVMLNRAKKSLNRIHLSIIKSLVKMAY